MIKLYLTAAAVIGGIAYVAWSPSEVAAAPDEQIEIISCAGNGVCEDGSIVVRSRDDIVNSVNAPNGPVWRGFKPKPLPVECHDESCWSLDDALAFYNPDDRG